MFWTAFVWGIGATTGGSIGLMVFVVLFAVWSEIWSRITKTPAVVRARELSELMYSVMVERKELSAKQLDVLNTLAYNVGTIAGVMEQLTIEDDENNEDDRLCDHPHDTGKGFFG